MNVTATNSSAGLAPGAGQVVMPGEGEEWVVLHTRPRAEKKAAQSLERLGGVLYLPLRRKDHRYQGRVRTFWSPLFAGYVFGLFPSVKVNGLKSNEYVANVLRVVDQRQFVKDVRQIQLALASGNLVDVMPFLERGKRVRITGGSMKGVEGIVERVGQTARVVISIELIQQSVYVEVDSALIDTI